MSLHSDRFQQIVAPAEQTRVLTLASEASFLRMPLVEPWSLSSSKAAFNIDYGCLPPEGLIKSNILLEEMEKRHVRQVTPKTSQKREAREILTLVVQ